MLVHAAYRRLSSDPLNPGVRVNSPTGLLLSAADLLALARRPRLQADCPRCAALVCPGWESLSGGFDHRVSVSTTVACIMSPL